MSYSAKDDPKYWSDLAEEARARAEESPESKNKQTLLDVARTYDNMARQAAQRLSDAKPS
jgi:hypothetical protein